jgi:hypothetical protein
MPFFGSGRIQSARLSFGKCVTTARSDAVN